jgi:protoporphyrinogen/coproporphyrinogen III oxidase
VSSAELVIVGGGVSGLASAYYCGRLGIGSILVEKTERLGGLIKTDRIEGCQLEAGPDSYIVTKPAVTELAEEIGLQSEIIASNDAARRVFIVRSGKLVPLPDGMSMMVPGKLRAGLQSGLFGLNTKLRFISEMFFRPLERNEDISVGRLVSDHFGREVLEYVADPLLVGVYGGDSQDLSAHSVLPRFVGYEQRYGSLIRGVQAENKSNTPVGLFRSFRQGMQSLTDFLADRITGSTRVVHREATAVSQNGQTWIVRAGTESLRAKHLVLACPAAVCARLLENAAPELAESLADIPYSSAILVTLLFPADQVRHPLDGFGFLVPRRERRTLAAATWINRKFPSRIAPDLVAVRGFIVGDNAATLREASDPELVSLVRDEFRRLMGIEVPPRTSVVSRWPESMPQYVVGHNERIRRIQTVLSSYSGLHLVGNAYDGVGIPDCIRRARETAKAIAMH